MLASAQAHRMDLIVLVWLAFLERLVKWFRTFALATVKTTVLASRMPNSSLAVTVPVNTPDLDVKPNAICAQSTCARTAVLVWLTAVSQSASVHAALPANSATWLSMPASMVSVTRPTDA